jgi:hypothetical protein
MTTGLGLTHGSSATGQGLPRWVRVTIVVWFVLTVLSALSVALA